MSRTLTLTATAARAPSKEEEAPKPLPLIDARLIDALFARGVRAVPSARAGEFLYTGDASSSPIVATAVRFSEDGHSVDKAFTRGDWSLSDNFDAVAGGQFVAVENLTFGPAKTFIERAEAIAFIANGARWPDARVLTSLPQFAKGVDRLASLEAALEAHPEYHELQAAPDSGFARMGFIDALSRRHLADVYAAVLKFSRTKGLGLEDPVFAAAFKRMPALSDLDEGGAVTSDEYFAERLALLAYVPQANPRFSKLAFGRLAWFPLLSEPWDRLSAWTVFFARRLQLARQPDLLALPFLMLNRPEEYLFHCEMSDKDNLRAVETPVPQGAESPLDVLLPAYGDDAAAEAFWARLRALAQARRGQRARRAQPPSFHRHAAPGGRGQGRRRAQVHGLGGVGRPLPPWRGLAAVPAAPPPRAHRTRARDAAAPVARGPLRGPRRARCFLLLDRGGLGPRALCVCAEEMNEVCALFGLGFIFHIALVARSARRSAVMAARTSSTDDGQRRSASSSGRSKSRANSARANASPYERVRHIARVKVVEMPRERVRFVQGNARRARKRHRLYGHRAATQHVCGHALF
jgi:hypothetical protein